MRIEIPKIFPRRLKLNDSELYLRYDVASGKPMLVMETDILGFIKEFNDYEAMTVVDWFQDYLRAKNKTFVKKVLL